LKGDYEHPEDIANLVVLASSTSFYFSHRVWFFYQSTMYQEMDDEIYTKSRHILKALKSVCLENRKEKLYLANSKDLVNLIVELNLTEFWPSLRLDRHVKQSLNMLPIFKPQAQTSKSAALQQR
jgi:hypothetical protein